MKKEKKGDWNAGEKNGFSFGKLFWGILFIFIAVFLILDKIGIVTGISVWSVLFTVVFGAMLIDGLFKKSWTCIFFSIAFLCIIYDEQLGITELTPWTVLLAALFLSIGMNMIFYKNGERGKYIDFRVELEKDKNETDGSKHTGWEENTAGGEKIFQMNRFSSLSKYINPEMFQKGLFDNSFGNMNIYFENVPTQNEEGFLEVNNLFGEINFYIPSSWLLDINVKNSFGDTNVRNGGNGKGEFVLHVMGSSSFGEVRFIYQ